MGTCSSFPAQASSANAFYFVFAACYTPEGLLFSNCHQGRYAHKIASTSRGVFRWEQ